ncbi:hemin transport protein HmuS [Klebsiella pneumoniae]|uniref:Hemin transport protein HmuS n=1 Tax=Klebsiella pneumoniae TaxID=573 RepID=A0A2X1QGZ6_KLEPN|nr:hemin transport protein HmuS [Klebsiella pneumoniae]
MMPCALSDDARALIAALERVGETKCICRNEYAVHEQVGQFTHQHLSGHAGLVLNPRRSTCVCSSASGPAPSI